MDTTSFSATAHMPVSKAVGGRGGKRKAPRRRDCLPDGAKRANLSPLCWIRLLIIKTLAAQGAEKRVKNSPFSPPIPASRAVPAPQLIPCYSRGVRVLGWETGGESG